LLDDHSDDDTAPIRDDRSPEKRRNPLLERERESAACLPAVCRFTADLLQRGVKIFLSFWPMRRRRTRRRRRERCVRRRRRRTVRRRRRGRILKGTPTTAVLARFIPDDETTKVIDGDRDSRTVGRKSQQRPVRDCVGGHRTVER
jgi:hypothetical protein